MTGFTHQNSPSGALEVEADERGIRGVLEFLNARTPHRFTGVYRFDPPSLRNLQLFDSANPGLEMGDAVPMRETYCSIVGERDAHFATPDAAAHPELADHPARDSVLSYCGVPLYDATGQPYGTLCHFDMVPHTVPEAEVPVMEHAATVLRDLLPR